MGDVVKFDPEKRRKWTRPEDYGAPPPPRPPKKPKKPKRPRKRTTKPETTWGQALRSTRPILLLIAAIAVWAIGGDPRWGEPPAFLQTDPEMVQGNFTRCGPGRGQNCVIDGDTFKIGSRSIRVAGIDTAEKDARCEREAALAERSTVALMDWLNRGPFQMTARIDDRQDHYGRDVRIVKRIGEGGAEDRLADFMISKGEARSYRGGFRSGWCG